MADPLVTVTAYTGPADARAAKGALDSAGIASVVDDAIERRVKVRVTNLDAIRAGDVLTERVPTLVEIDEADEDERDAVCPACGSPDVVSARRARTFALVVTLAITIGFAAGLMQAAFFAIAAAAMFLLIAGRRRCQSCNETWD
jgi:hypothetical protein